MTLNNDDLELGNLGGINREEIGAVSNFTQCLFKKKCPDDMIKSAEGSGLKKTLNAFDLIMLGVGAIIGSGIFTVVGIAAAGGPQTAGAGPALVVSMILASLACVFSAMCYSEFASMIPAAGSAYLYTYATMGEFLAWIVGWVLVLEYLVGYIAVSAAWTGYFMQFLKGFEHVLPSWLVNPPIWLISDYQSASYNLTQQHLNPADIIPSIGGIPIAMNLPGIIVAVLICTILIRGIKESTKVAGIMVFIKLGVIALFVITGAFYIRPENWTPFAPNGFEGIFMGAFIIFFAYIGFDAIATAAEETKNPQKNLPIGIIGSLAICTIVYVLVALVLTGVVPMGQIDTHAPIAHAMRFVGKDWIAGLISIGALTGLSSVLLVLMLAGSRVLYAMSRDNFLPKILQSVHKKYKTPYIITIMVALICIVGSLFLNLNIAAELCNFGTFTSFIIVCVAVIILRKIDPDRHRPFKVPFVPWFPLLGIICCGGLMFYSMKDLTTSRVLFPIWLVIGAVIYFSFGYKEQRKLEKRTGQSAKDSKSGR